MALLRQCLFELRAAQQAQRNRPANTASAFAAAAGHHGRHAERARPSGPAFHPTATGDFNGRATLGVS